MRIVDLNNLYSAVGGGVRTYHHQKLEYFAGRPEHSYAMIVPGPERRTVDRPGGRIHFVRGLPVQTKDSTDGYFLMLDPRPVLRLLAEEWPDVVEVGGPYTDPWLGKLATLYSNPLFVAFYHLEFRDAHIEPRIRAWPPWAQRATMRFFDAALRVLYQRQMAATFVASEVVRRELAEIGVTNTILTPLGVDIDKFDPARRDESVRAGWGAGPRDRVLLHAGRLSVEKGTRTVLDAAGAILEDESVHLAFAGRGGLAPEVEALAAKHGRVHFLGYVSDPSELGAAFASADGYIAAGPYETFGLAVLEALASGLPVVAADEGAGMELVEKSGAGFVFAAQDPRSLAAQAARLLEGDLGALSARARRYAVEHGTWKRTFDTMFAHYEELLARRRLSAAPA